MHPAEYITRYADNCASAGHAITETRETRLGNVTLPYHTCKCGAKSRV